MEVQCKCVGLEVVICEELSYRLSEDRRNGYQIGDSSLEVLSPYAGRQV